MNERYSLIKVAIAAGSGLGKIAAWKIRSASTPNSVRRATASSAMADLARRRADDSFLEDVQLDDGSVEVLDQGEDPKAPLLGARASISAISIDAQLPRLSWREKIIYPLGDVPGTVSGLLISIFLQSFLLEAVQLSAYWTGTVLLLGHLMSVVSNPMVGQLSDGTHTRWGRRRPWIAWWAIPFGIFYACLWLAPAFLETQLDKFGWYAGFYMLWTLSHSATAVPYAALTPEICYRDRDRNFVTTLRFVFSLVGGVACIFSQYAVIESLKEVNSANNDDVNLRVGYAVSGLTLGAFFIILYILLVWAVQETYLGDDQKLPPELRGFKGFFRGLLIIAKNKAYLICVSMFVLAWSVTNVVQSNLILLLHYLFNYQEMAGYLLAVLLLSIAGSLFGWEWLVRRVGKRNAYFIGIMIWSAGQLAAFLLPTDAGWAFWIIMPVVGSGVGAGILVPWAMLPEVVELDEVISHQKRGGLYYSVFGVLQQLGVAGALSVSSWVLGKCGYVSPKDQTGENPQPQDVLTFFRVILGPAAVLMLLLSALCCFFYPITKEMKEANSKILRDRREAVLKAKKAADGAATAAAPATTKQTLDIDDSK